MANPQLENGYMKIANELFVAIMKFRFSGEIRQVFDLIMRKTYGFNKRSTNISVSMIVQELGYKPPNASRCLKKMLSHRLIIKLDNNNVRGNEIEINKDFEQWISLVIRSDNQKMNNKKLSSLNKNVSSLITEVIEIDNKMLSSSMYIKDNEIHSKDNNTNTKRTRDDIALDIIRTFAIVNPAYEKFIGDKDQIQACLDIMKTQRIAKIKYVIQNTLPMTNRIAYMPTILSPIDLFRKWASLEAAVMKYKDKIGKITKGQDIIA